MKETKSFELKLTKQELKRWNRESKWFIDNVITPMNFIAETTDDGELKNSPECRSALGQFIRENLNSTGNVFGYFQIWI